MHNQQCKYIKFVLLKTNSQKHLDKIWRRKKTSSI